MSSLLQLSLLLLLLLCLLAQPASSQPSVYGAPQVQPNSLSGGSYVVELIAAASNSSSGAAFYLVDVNFAVKAVSPSGVLLATSSFCSGYSAAFTVNFCSSLEPRPHGAVVWVRGKSVREADAFTTGFTAALDATTLALVVSIPDTLLSPAPTYSVVNELSGGSVCTDSSGSAYLIGVGEVWRLSVSGVQLGYFTVPSAVVPNGVLAYSPQLVGAFDRQDLLWLFSVAPWNGTASFGVWRTTPSNGSLVSSGNLTLPGVRWSRNLFLAAGSVSIDSAGYAYVGVRDNDYVDAQSVYRAVYVFDGQYNSAAVIDPPQGQDQLNEAALGFGSSSIAWGSAAGQDRLYASALGNFSVAVLSTSSLAVLGSITPQASPLLATQFLSYDASTDSFVAMQPVRPAAPLAPLLRYPLSPLTLSTRCSPSLLPLLLLSPCSVRVRASSGWMAVWCSPTACRAVVRGWAVSRTASARSRSPRWTWTWTDRATPCSCSSSRPPSTDDPPPSTRSSSSPTTRSCGASTPRRCMWPWTPSTVPSTCPRAAPPAGWTCSATTAHSAECSPSTPAPLRCCSQAASTTTSSTATCRPAPWVAPPAR